MGLMGELARSNRWLEMEVAARREPLQDPGVEDRNRVFAPERHTQPSEKEIES